MHRIGGRPRLAKTHDCGRRDSDARHGYKPADSVPWRGDPVKEREPAVECPHEGGREQHQDRGWNASLHRSPSLEAILPLAVTAFADRNWCGVTPVRRLKCRVK